VLVKEGATVKALSYYNSFGNWGWMENSGCLNEIEILTADDDFPAFCESHHAAWDSKDYI
jgi:hypothetical protein